jgi:hypothetical protein
MKAHSYTRCRTEAMSAAAAEMTHPAVGVAAHDDVASDRRDRGAGVELQQHQTVAELEPE